LAILSFVMANRSKKIPVGLRLTPDANTLLREMASATGLPMAGVIELSIREKAASLGVTLPDGARVSPMAAAIARHKAKPIKSSGPVDAVADVEELRATRAEKLAR